MMKRVLLIFLIASNLISAKDYNLFNQTKTKVTLKNEFGVAYPYAKVVFSSLDTNYVVSVDQNGQAVLNIQQGIEFTVSCFIKENKYEFNDIIYIEKNKNIYEASIDLQFDLYEKIFEIKNVEHESIFYQMGQTQVYDMVCELIEYSNQRFNTGRVNIDEYFAEYNTDIIVDANNATLNAISTTDDLARNLDFEVEGDSILDFSEVDPFSENIQISDN